MTALSFFEQPVCVGWLVVDESPPASSAVNESRVVSVLGSKPQVEACRESTRR